MLAPFYEYRHLPYEIIGRFSEIFPFLLWMMIPWAGCAFTFLGNPNARYARRVLQGCTMAMMLFIPLPTKAARQRFAATSPLGKVLSLLILCGVMFIPCAVDTYRITEMLRISKDKDMGIEPPVHGRAYW